MRRKAIEESRRLENDQRMRKNLIGRAAGIDLDNDCEQARQHVRFARRAEIEKAVATDSCEPGVPRQLRSRLRSTFMISGSGCRRRPKSMRVS